MEGWTPNNITAMVVAISGFLTMLCSKKVVTAFITFSDWYYRVRAKRMELRAIDEELNERGNKTVIRLLDRRIDVLEKNLTLSMSEHAKCREEYAVLRLRCETIERDLERYRLDRFPPRP